MNDEQLDNLIKSSCQTAGSPRPVSFDGAVIRQRARVRREVRRVVMKGLLLMFGVSLWFWSWGWSSNGTADARMVKLEEDIARLQAENMVLLESVDYLRLQNQQSAIELVREQLNESWITSPSSVAEGT